MKGAEVAGGAGKAGLATGSSRMGSSADFDSGWSDG